MTQDRPQTLKFTDVRRDAKNKWVDILSACGVDKAFLSKRQGPCPICRDGKDRYRFDDKGEGRWFCNGAGAEHHGDGFDLLREVKGWTPKEVLEEVAKLAGTARPTTVKAGPEPEKVRADIREMQRAAKPLEAVPAARAYWLARVGIVPDFPKVLRAVHQLRAPSAELYPASLAFIQNPDGSGANVQRVFLTPDGQKAKMDEPRRLMPIGLPEGAAVRLGEPVDGVMGVAEGVETAVAAWVLTGVPCWSVLNTRGLKVWRAPAGVRKVIVFGDHDANFAGQAAAYSLGNSLSVGKDRIEAEVRIPDKTGDDWNDVLLRHLERSAAA